jgi:hypothetical protein
MNLKISPVAAVVGLAYVAAMSGALAAESGSYKDVASFVTDYTTIEHADGTTITGGPIRGTGTIISSTGGPFPAGSSTVFVCMVYAKKGSAGFDLEAPCTGTDPESGDKMFTTSLRKAGDIPAGGAGRQSILGGTGRYAGITGSCSFEVTYLPDNHGVSQNSCEWQKP